MNSWIRSNERLRYTNNFKAWQIPKRTTSFEGTQYNLLYAVSFLRSQEEVQGFTSLSVNAYDRGEHSDGQLTINIFGKPIPKINPTRRIKVELCFGSFYAKEPSRTEHSLKNTKVLPEPPEPFPVVRRREGLYRPSTPPLSRSKRHILSGSVLASSRLVNIASRAHTSAPITPLPLSMLSYDI
ncbi:uncharacterized protein ARMOST_04677 [Armillaria ostoyae]|uniref:Uncharacterized protein n=1 Tax=Armillaria ostoyae TaxID=47428 RepID=A0A284QXZ8_ARMOS|nr:uncharacterized protein ARMOST_04677 [Armillaria ostoyae]